ncbi:MAG: hypothetical protein K8R88_14390 [Armatimonadetes bacterium]|nr:hypothetical protein [Armatimonadota bacterium]
MNNIWKTIGIIVLAFIGFKVAIGLIGFIWGIILPIAILGAVVYGIYKLSGGRALTGGRRTLP